MKKLFFILLISMTTCFAAQDFYLFEQPEQHQRFQQLTTQLRCLVCQNQNIAESNAPLAADLREQVFQQIVHGHSDQEIVDFLVARYGDFVLYRPPLNFATIGLWFGPFLFLAAGLGYLFYYLRKQRKQNQHDKTL